MSYYKIINGIRYDRAMLSSAEALRQSSPEQLITLEGAQQLYLLASDGRHITETEWRTLRYVSTQFQFTPPAKEWLDSQLSPTETTTDLDTKMARIIKQEFGLMGMRWQIDPLEMDRQSRKTQNLIGFEDAVRSALKAFIERDWNQLSVGSVVGRRVLGAENEAANQANIRNVIGANSLLWLIPESDTDRQNLEFDLPNGLDTNTFWHFGLHVPALSPVLFAASVLRHQPNSWHHIGYVSRKPELDTIIHAVVKQLAQFTRLQWQIDPAEVSAQLLIKPNQNFGDALFAALYTGVFNGESSFSFRDFIRQDIWQDPDRDLEFYMRDYIETGTLHLLNSAGNADFPIPENFRPYFDNDWAFGLTMPKRTDVRLVITASREMGIDASWNDGFIAETLSFEDQIKRVVVDEFKLDGLTVMANENEYNGQRMQIGPDYRSFTSLLRQALNTILHDYLGRTSPFNVVAEVHRDNTDPNNFDDPHEYRAAIKHYIIEYLKTATLEFLPMELPDNNPPDGESIQDSWQFFGLMPGLADIGFWVIIPRYPDDEQRSYCYGFN